MCCSSFVFTNRSMTATPCIETVMRKNANTVVYSSRIWFIPPKNVVEHARQRLVRQNVVNQDLQPATGTRRMMAAPTTMSTSEHTASGQYG